MYYHSILKKRLINRLIKKYIYLHHTQHTVRGIYSYVSFNTRTFFSKTTDVWWPWALFIGITWLVQKKISYKIIHDLLMLLLHQNVIWQYTCMYCNVFIFSLTAFRLFTFMTSMIDQSKTIFTNTSPINTLAIWLYVFNISALGIRNTSSSLQSIH